MPNILWFQLLTCEDLLLFFVINDSRLNTFGFSTVDRTKQGTRRTRTRLNYIIRLIMKMIVSCCCRLWSPNVTKKQKDKKNVKPGPGITSTSKCPDWSWCSRCFFYLCRNCRLDTLLLSASELLSRCFYKDKQYFKRKYLFTFMF